MCCSRAACARTRPRIPPTATTSTTPAANYPPLPLPPPPRPPPPLPPPPRPPPPPATAAAAPARRGAAAPGAAAPGGPSTGPPPAPAGHRTRGRGTSGGLLYARLSAAVRGAGVRVLTQTTARHLVTDPGGRVTGVECLSLRAAPSWARLAHRVLHRWSVRPYLYVPKLSAGSCIARSARLEHHRRYARPLRIEAARGVILAVAGFAANRAMMRAHAPNARGAPAPGHPRRRRQRYRPRHRRSAAPPRSWTGCPSGGSSARRPPCWGPASLVSTALPAGVRRVPPLAPPSGRRDPPARPPGLAARRPRHPDAGPPPDPRPGPVVPAVPGLVPADPGRGPAPTVPMRSRPGRGCRPAGL